MTASAYDAVPYQSHAQAETHLDVLAAQATLFGMKPARPDACRALFIGCASGWNLLPMATLLPATEFVGFDLSPRQIEAGRADVAALGLTNVDLRVMDASAPAAHLGQFDYIIAHGVYSWVPADAQAAVLNICRDNLAAQGVAYVSYNCKPGWQVRALLRDMMQLHTAGLSDPAQKVRQARAMLGFLGRAAQVDNQDAYGRWLGDEVMRLGKMADFYLLHEHLAPENEALWFHEFVRRARDARLQYLGEPTLGQMMGRGLPAKLRQELDEATGDLIGMQQYLDFARGRQFRRSLLVHADVKLDRGLNWRSLRPLRIATPARVGEEGAGVQEAALDDDSEVTFRRKDAELTSVTPLLKRALWLLGRSWPAAIGFDELAAQAADACGYEGDAAQAQQALGGDLLNATASAFVDLAVTQRPAVRMGDRPCTPAFMRLQAERGQSLLTSALHHPLPADETMRTLVRFCDGSRDRRAIDTAMIEAAMAGAFKAGGDGPVGPARAMRGLVQRTLAQMERSGVFVAPGG